MYANPLTQSSIAMTADTDLWRIGDTDYHKLHTYSTQLPADHCHLICVEYMSCKHPLPHTILLPLASHYAYTYYNTIYSRLST